jgi:hypothetical protein
LIRDTEAISHGELPLRVARRDYRAGDLLIRATTALVLPDKWSLVRI